MPLVPVPPVESGIWNRGGFSKLVWEAKRLESSRNPRIQAQSVREAGNEEATAISCDAWKDDMTKGTTGIATTKMTMMKKKTMTFSDERERGMKVAFLDNDVVRERL